MANIQGIIRKTTLNSLSQFEKMGYFSENFGNTNTNSYKAVRFDDVLNEGGYVSGMARRDFSQGQLRQTRDPFNVAIDGAGFIPVTNKNGEILYTRDGSLTQDKDGTIVTYSGDIVGGGIKLDVNYAKLEIKQNGDVYTYKNAGDKPEYKGTIPIVTFANPQGLEEAGDNNYKKTDASGEAELLKDHQKIAQYNVEMSNVDLFEEVNDIMRLNASLLATTSLMSVIDDMYNKAINLRG